MNVSCPGCETVFRIDPDKVPAEGTQARCSVCSETINLTPQTETSAPPVVAAEPVTEPATEEQVTAVRTAVEQPEPEEEVRLSKPFVMPSSPPAAAPEAAAPEQQTRPSAPVFRPTPGSPVVAPPVAQAPSPEPVVEEVPEPVVEAVSETVTPEPEPVAPAVPATAPAAGRPVNPFMSKDPKLKARRLARALVSDMIVYQPDKRKQAMEAGTLKEDFDEEIKKSWEEYVDQVGEETANSTPFFRDALNEILAAGKQMF